MIRPLEVVVGGTTLTFLRGGPCAWLLSGLPVCPAPLVWLFPCCCWFFCSYEIKTQTLKRANMVKHTHPMAFKQWYQWAWLYRALNRHT